ncbi:MAG: hypothetical protein L0G99_16155 [Propionibacteriales bacterium]|nr:hypothetical protein [Propionibacteriales bacterium]
MQQLDDTGTLTLRWDGHHITSVSLANRWQRRLPASDLGRTLATLIARRRAHLAELTDGDVGRAVEIEPLATVGITPLESLALLEAAESLLAESRRSLDEATDAARRRTVGQVEVSQPSRHVRLFRHEGDVMWVEVDHRWAEQRLAGEVIAELDRALVHTELFPTPTAPSSRTDSSERMGTLLTAVGIHPRTAGPSLTTERN